MILTIGDRHIYDFQRRLIAITVGLRYHIHINTPEEDITFHDQVGYWLWEPATGLILQTVAIPRGQVLLASGQAKPDDMTISVTAKRGDTCYGICSTEFLDEAFRT